MGHFLSIFLDGGKLECAVEAEVNLAFGAAVESSAYVFSASVTRS